MSSTHWVEWVDCANPGALVRMPLEDGGAMIIDSRFNLKPNYVRLAMIENQLLTCLDKIRHRNAILKFGVESGWGDRDRCHSEVVGIGSGGDWLSIDRDQLEFNKWRLE